MALLDEQPYIGYPQMGRRRAMPNTDVQMNQGLLRGASYYPYDLLGYPIDLINMGLKPLGMGSQKPVMGSDYLQSLAQQYGLSQQPTGSNAENVARLAMSAMNPATGARVAGNAIRGAEIGLQKVTTPLGRPQASPYFLTETAVTDPALLQNVDLNNAIGMGLSRERLNAARQATGSQYAQAPMGAAQGAWQGSQGFEANPVFMQELPKSFGDVKAQDYMKYAAQTSENLIQDGNGVARFIPFLINDTIRSNAAVIKNVTPEQLKKLGEAGLTDKMVIAARPDNKALIMGFDDKAGQIPDLLAQIKKVIPDVKYDTGISKQDVDRIYMVKNPNEDGIPTFADFGAIPRQNGLLDVLDERLRQDVY